MAITDLTNTKWTFNDVLDTEEENITYSLIFQSNNENFTQLRLYNDSSYPNQMWYRSSTSIYVYENGWSLPLYKTILITGGTAATNSTFITWLQKNAVQDTGVLGVWKFNKTLDIAEYYTSYDINFTTPYGDYQDQYNFLGFNLIGDYPAGRDRLGYLTDGAVGVTVYDTDYSLKWVQYYFRIVNITGGNDLYNSELQTLLNSNAKKITPIELTNTTWVFDENDLIFPMNSTTININFTSNSSNFTKITFSNNSTISYYSPKLGGNMTVYTKSNGFTPVYKRIEITDGADVSTESAEILIAANAAQIITYTTTNTELSSIADAIREKGNTTEQLVYPDGFVSAIENISAGGDPNAELYKQWALNMDSNTMLIFQSSISSHYNFIYNLSDIIESGAFAQRFFSGDFTFNSLTVVPSYAFAMINQPYAVSHTFNFSNCSIVGFGAFYSRQYLTSVNLPNVGTISSSAFWRCRNLINVSIPNCTSIGANAFQSCNSLTSISIPKCTSIGGQAFYGTGLSEIYGPSCEVIDIYAFAYCPNLVTASFPKCQLISNYTFYQCSSNLTTVDFSICSSIYTSAFAYCYKLSSISFPKVKNISQSAFMRCSLLTTVSFPECTSIAYSAFFGCSNLQSVYLLGSQVVSLGTGVFYQTPITNSTYTGSFGSIYVPSSLLDTYKSSTNWAEISARLVGM